MTDGRVHVAVAALVRGDGRVLVMQRLPGTPHAGRWEFPGGKLAAGETVEHALRRELDEELGIAPTRARPLMRIRHDYPQRRVLLDCWRVDAWNGDAVAREGHPLAWHDPSELRGIDLLEADRPLIAALRLPTLYAITADLPANKLVDEVERLVDAGHALIQLRAPSLAAAGFRAVAADAVAMCRLRGATLLLNAAPELVLDLGADGVHLNAARVAALRDRPLPPSCWVGASCHDAIEIARARALGCDFAVLGPVAPTPSHPRSAPLGWRGFAALADCAGLPVYALGGMAAADTDTAWTNHGQGIAGITAF